ncbi:MAG: hypothetical protein KBS47_01950 [Bacteroidales bacterium]|nr:hypothetical protein [Candidatus Equimonas enterica]
MQTKMYALLVALLATLAFVACTGDDDVTDGGALKQLSFSAVADAGSRPSYASERMKTQLHPDKNNSVTFSAGDAISVFDGTTHQNKRFATNEDGASVTFSGAAPESATYTALYPYQEDASISGSTLSAVLPTTQYAQSGTTFDSQTVLSVATTTSEEMEFAFKNVCGLVKFTTTEPLAKVVFKGNGNEKVAGAVSIVVGDTPTATGDAASIELLPLSAATSFDAGTYYISVLPQAFANGFTLEAYKSASSTSADYALEISTPIEVERSQILNVGKVDSSANVNANGHEFVDLGIEVDGKKVLWATMNVGATTKTGYGDYFAWGETEPKSDYSWATYKWGTSSAALTKYTATDGKTVLELTDDAAHVNWGSDWVMPTRAELQALYDNTTLAWTDNYNSTGVAGRVFTSTKDPSKSIFLPAAGYFCGTSVDNVGSNSGYWSSSLYTDNLAYAYCLYGVDPVGNYRRVYGLSVRPVLRIAIK